MSFSPCPSSLNVTVDNCSSRDYYIVTLWNREELDSVLNNPQKADSLQPIFERAIWGDQVYTEFEIPNARISSHQIYVSVAKLNYEGGLQMIPGQSVDLSTVKETNLIFQDHAAQYREKLKT